jgi:type IX secretion system PorP/SprF family membrane protein
MLFNSSSLVDSFKKASSVFVIIFFSLKSSLAQDPLLLNGYSNPIALNPAFTGGSEGNAIYTTYRHQWPKMASPYRTLLTTADIPLDKINGGFGLLFEDDRSGDAITKNSYLLTYAYSLNVGESVSIRGGLKAGIKRSKLDLSKLTYGDMIDPRRGFIYETQITGMNSSITYPDFGTGFLLSTKKLDLGFSLDHVNRANNIFRINKKMLCLRTGQ